MNDKKLLLTLWLIVSSIVNLWAQAAKPSVSQGPTSYSLNNMLTDLKGEPLLAGNDVSVEGSPFYSSTWSRGSISLLSGKKIENLMVKVNLHTDRVHYLLEDTNTERVASLNAISEVEFTDPETNQQVRFRCGFPIVAKNDLKTFYKVLSQGKATLLKQDKRILVEEKPFNSATINRRFDNDRDFFIYLNSQMISFKRTKSGLMEALNDHTQEVEKFISDNKIRLKTDEDLARVIAYYNTL